MHKAFWWLLLVFWVLVFVVAYFGPESRLRHDEMAWIMVFVIPVYAVFKLIFPNSKF